MVGLTATVGVGDKSKNQPQAQNHVLRLCAMLGLTRPPTKVENEDNVKELELLRDPPEKGQFFLFYSELVHFSCPKPLAFIQSHSSLRVIVGKF